ncbi:putative inner dynein arm light chain, axonemal [Stegodyphus dumicola]|uniref:putative inner dynein arm light chain, axonemal n=1 Tax=Stegodyphus dumicola TaxID=202533 RepID=UPI0015A9BEDB|nr:putative inner dynein arm light chain, axonemal [Stegodyphus dumicola]
MFPSSLVQYENPQMVLHHSTKAAIEANKEKAKKMILMSIDELMAEGNADVLDMLDVLLPPRIMKADKDNTYWYQKVSRASASSSDVMRLQERLDEELQKRGAREIGPCDVRRELYDQCFDELIRQECVVCPERGRLLRMVRRENQVSIDSLISCYESSLAYGLKKRLSSADCVNRLTRDITNLLSESARLSDIICDLQPKVAQVKKQTASCEVQKRKEFDAAEKKLRDENESVLAHLMQSIAVSIEEET